MNAVEQNLPKDTKILPTSIAARPASSPVPASAKTTTPSMVEFTITGRPVSVNHLYFTTPQRFRAMTKEGKNFKTMVGWLAKQAMTKNGFSKREKSEIFVTINFYFETKRGDIDNCCKAILDAMTGIIYKDDSQIVQLHLYKHKDKDNPCAVVLITAEEDKNGE